MPGKLKVRSEKEGNITLIRVEGEVHNHNASILDEGLARDARRGEQVVLDMEKVTLLTSPGLGLLIKHTERLRDPDKIVIAGLQAKVLEVFRALGLDQFFNIVDTVEEGVRFFTGEPSTKGKP